MPIHSLFRNFVCWLFYNRSHSLSPSILAFKFVRVFHGGLWSRTSSPDRFSIFWFNKTNRNNSRGPISYRMGRRLMYAFDETTFMKMPLKNSIRTMVAHLLTSQRAICPFCCSFRTESSTKDSCEFHQCRWIGWSRCGWWRSISWIHERTTENSLQPHSWSFQTDQRWISLSEPKRRVHLREIQCWLLFSRTHPRQSKSGSDELSMGPSLWWILGYLREVSGWAALCHLLSPENSLTHLGQSRYPSSGFVRSWNVQKPALSENLRWQRGRSGLRFHHCQQRDRPNTGKRHWLG